MFLYLKQSNNIEFFSLKDDIINVPEELIPKIIIQTWKTNNIPNNYKTDVNSLKMKNPDYEYLFFTDADIDTFLKEKYPKYFKTYNKLPVNIQKFDFFRYIAVYHYGGFYFDLDITGLEPLDDLLINDCIFPIDDFIHPNMCNFDRYTYFCKKNLNFLLGQYAFAAKPKHPFIKLLIDTIHNNINSYINDLNNQNYINFEIYVYQTTGPDFVSKLYLEYKNKYAIHILDYNKRQYFGKYARHNYYGSWKKNLNN
jgi:mannosyltransferase OCH1-like enzyme